jgi:peptidoglycan/xylan/chitin deacetylase (PgdA/CDA1 family)
VLMYHRIAEDGPPGLADYRVSAAAFSEQLRLLRRHGFHAVTPDEVMSRFERGRPLAGRPVMITFDDGYQDFADVAWPLLKRNDFSAHVFVVTNLVGQESHWDRQFGPTAPLMDWETIRSLAKEGASFGSHLATHRAANSLTSSELLQEAYGSRLRLEAELGRPVRSVAAPFGIYDERLLYVLRLAGYQSAFTTDEGMASITDDPHCFPRIEVAGGLALDAFAAAVGLDGDG